MSNSVYRRPQWRPLLLCLLALVFTAVSGCGKRGDPMPPSLVVPAPIKSLHVVAKPGKSFLAWSLPRKNSDGSRPVDLVAFRIYHKRVPVGEDSCKFCDEGFRKEFDIVVRKPDRGYILGETFYFPYDCAAP
jgi:predicted small lipoprotein YifL